MIPDGYLAAHLITDPTRDEQHAEVPFNKGFHGKVVLDVPDVTHESFGSLHIKAEFPRIKPRFEREELQEGELEHLEDNLRKWVDDFFDRTEAPEYFEDLIQASALFSSNINPFHDVKSDEMDLVNKMYFWLWHTDDILEYSIEKGVGHKSLHDGVRQILSIVRNKRSEFVPVPDFPGIEHLYKSFADLHDAFASRNEEHHELADAFAHFLQKYFEAMRWYSNDKIDGRYTEETFRFWRRIVAYFDGIAEVVCLIHGISLSTRVLTSPSFRRILDITNSVGGFVNDILGLKKEFKHGQKDSLIVFKVLQKGIPLEQAVQQVCQLVEDEVSDYLLLRDAVLREFSEEPNLIKYIDILESLMDGHNRIYVSSERHLSVGHVTLSR